MWLQIRNDSQKRVLRVVFNYIHSIHTQYTDICIYINRIVYGDRGFLPSLFAIFLLCGREMESKGKGKRGRGKWEGVNALQSTRVERGLPVKPIYHITQYTMRVWLKVKVKIGGAFNFMSYFFVFLFFFLFGSTANVPLKF